MALAIASGALVLAIVVSGPLWWPKPAPPPPPPEPTLAQFIALVAKNGTLTPRQMALGAVLGAMALGLMSGGVKKNDPPESEAGRVRSSSSSGRAMPAGDVR